MASFGQANIWLMSSRVKLVNDSREPSLVDSANLVVMDGGTEHRGAEVGPDPKDEAESMCG